MPQEIRTFPITPDIPSGPFLLEKGKGWLSVVRAQAGVNLCTNPSFERDLSGCGVANISALRNDSFDEAGSGGADVFTFWQELLGNGSVSRDDNGLGSYCCKLNSGTLQTTEVYQDVNLRPGAQVTLTYSTKGNGVVAGRIGVYDVTHSADVIAVKSTGRTSGSWGELTETFTVPAGCLTIRVRLLCPASNSVDTWFDYARLTPAADSVCLVRSSEEQYFGSVSAKMTPFSPQATGFYWSFSLDTAGDYTISLHVKAIGGRPLYAMIASSTALVLAAGSEEIHWSASGYWERMVFHFTENSPGTTRYLSIAQESYPNFTPFYVDGIQIEAGMQATTYIDGDRVGFRTDTPAYFWNGTPHASSSTRLEDNSGGVEVSLLDLGFQAMAILGLGMIPFNAAATPMSNGGAMYQRSIPQVRDFSIAGSINGSIQQQQTVQRQLIYLFNPLQTAIPQPIRLIYQKGDACDNAQSDRVLIDCVYLSGLEGQIANEAQNRVGIAFRQFIPNVAREQEGGAELLLSHTVGNSQVFAFNQDTGDLNYLDGGLTHVIYSLAALYPNKVYAVGLFTSPGTYFALWNGVHWVSVNDTLDAPPDKVIIAPNEDVFLGGNFTGRLKRYSPTDGLLHAVGTAPDDWVCDLAIGPDGYLYAAGFFHNIGGIAANHIARCNLSTGVWSALGSGMTNEVWRIAIAPDGTLYAYDKDTGKLKVWSGATWSETPVCLAKTEHAAETWNPWKVLFHPKTGELYALWINADMDWFTIERFNGVQWYPVIEGATLISSNFNFTFTEDGTLWYSRYSFKPGSFDLYDSPLGIYLGGSSMLLPFGFNAITELSSLWSFRNTIYALFQGYVGSRLYRLVQSGINDLEITSTRGAYPTFRLYGPGRLAAIQNTATGQAIYFKETLVLSNGEIATLKLEPGNYRFYSNLRSDLKSFVYAGSQLSFRLKYGVNRILMRWLEKGALVTTSNPTLDLSGLSDYDLSNTDNYKLYIDVDATGGNHLHIYKNVAKTLLVGHSTYVAAQNVQIVSEDNGSGLSGSVKFTGLTAETGILAYLPSAFLGWVDAIYSLDEAVR